MNYYDSIISSLPKKVDFLGRNKYSESVVLVPFVVINGTEYVLFQVRAAEIKQGNEVCFPGGMIDISDSSIESAALRETTEELGIPTEMIEIAGQFDSLVNPLGIIVRVVVGRLKIQALEELIINKAEVKEVFLVPVKWFKENVPEIYKLKLKLISKELDEDGKEQVYFPAKKLGVPEKYWDSWGGSLHNVYVYKYQDKIIWGITAEIVKELLN